MIERIDPELQVGERETLNQYLDYGRATLVKIVTGLTKEQLATTVGASDLTLAGLIKHLALVEDAWFVETFLGEPIPEPWTPIDWDGYTPPVPAQGVGVREFLDYDLAELREYIDWQPFFNAWELKGRYPDILNNPASGEAARKLWADAQAMLDTVVAEGWLKANGVIGFFPASAVDDDLEIYTDETRSDVRLRLHHLRQQGHHRDGVPNRSLADYVAPASSGLNDWIGGFAVTAGLGSAERVAAFKAELDDYSQTCRDFLSAIGKAGGVKTKVEADQASNMADACP
mgnify:CR=1 FL=1